MSINRQPNQQDLSWFIDMENQGRLDLNPPYQRRSVWTPKDRYYYLDTIFNNFPCPAIYLQKESTSTGPKYNVVDGKQRLQTILSFYNNKIKLPQDFSIIGLRGKRFKEIGEDYTSLFYNYIFLVEQLRAAGDQDWNEVFFRVNKNQKKLTDQELRHARFDGWLITQAEQEVSDLKQGSGKFWKDLKVSSLAKNRRMKDVEFISILMLVILEDQFVGFPQWSIDDLYAKYDFEKNDLTDSEEEIEVDHEDELSELPTLSTITNFEVKFEKIKAYILEMEESNSCITTYSNRLTTDFYSLWSFLHFSNVMDDRTAEVMGKIYEDFIRQVDMFFLLTKESEDVSELPSPVVKYGQNSKGAATEEGPRKNRNDAFSEFVKNYEG